jgi:hypothetical protein
VRPDEIVGSPRTAVSAWAVAPLYNPRHRSPPQFIIAAALSMALQDGKVARLNRTPASRARRVSSSATPNRKRPLAPSLAF